MKKNLSLCVPIFLFCFITSAFAQTIHYHYVKTIATGDGTGSSWDNASGDLQEMINASASGDQIWVAAGPIIR